MDPASLYLLKEAGALLAGASIAGALTGGASPEYMPTLPWSTNYRNTPAPIPTPPIMTRIPAGTGRPPSAYGEAGLLNSETGEAGSTAPAGSGISQAQWDALPASTQQAVLNELASRTRTAAPPVTMTSSNQAPGASPCPPGYINLGGGEFPNNCVPAHNLAPPATTTTTPPPAPPPQPAPPIMRPPPSAPPNVAPPPAQLLPPSGGGGGGGGPTPWGPLLVGSGVVLAFLYAGRRKKGRRR